MEKTDNNEECLGRGMSGDMITPLPLVSVITPSFNQGRFIKETIESVLGQDYPNIEYLVIDGGSTDNTLEILRKYGDRLTWVSESDKGQTDAINKGFRRARGEIVCWLNSDDTYEPGAISRAVEYFLAHPDVMMVYGEGNEIDDAGGLIQRFPATQEFDLWALIYIWDYILQPTTFFRKKIFDEIDLPDENLHWCMDWDLWIRIGRRFKIAYVDYVFANSRLYAATKTGSGGVKRLQEIAYVMRKYGKKRYPLGVFIFGEDTLETICRQRFPLLFRIFKPVFYASRVLLTGIQSRYQGYYKDKWLGRRVQFLFPRLKHIAGVSFKLEMMENPVLMPMTVEIKVDGLQSKRVVIEKPGKLDIEVPVGSPEKGPVELQLDFNKTFKPAHGRRRLTCLLHEIRIIERPEYDSETRQKLAAKFNA